MDLGFFINYQLIMQNFLCLLPNNEIQKILNNIKTISTNSNTTSALNNKLHHLHLKFNLRIVTITFIMALILNKWCHRGDSVVPGGSYHYYKGWFLLLSKS
jgi:hypothetical protein